MILDDSNDNEVDILSLFYVLRFRLRNLHLNSSKMHLQMLSFILLVENYPHKINNIYRNNFIKMFESYPNSWNKW